MDTASAGALVGGVASAAPPADGVDVRALRPVLWAGAIREVGEVFRVADRHDARMLAQWNKVQIVPAEAVAEPNEGGEE